MKFTWKAAKRTTNVKKHGFDFTNAEKVFNGPTFTVEDTRYTTANSALIPLAFSARPS